MVPIKWPVAVSLDGDGIPRVAAGSDLDAAAALGFVHARDRMFQMELMRRAASGRLSEIAGGATLRLDRTMRVLGLRRRAEADLPTLDPDTRAMLDAYAAGVNAWIAARGRLAAPEFIPLGTPEPWTAAMCSRTDRRCTSVRGDERMRKAFASSPTLSGRAATPSWALP